MGGGLFARLHHLINRRSSRLCHTKSKENFTKNGIAPLLELESGSNDPMAIFLTMTIIQMISLNSTPTATEWANTLLKQFGIGISMGYLFGVALPAIFNRLRLKSWGTLSGFFYRLDTAFIHGLLQDRWKRLFGCLYSGNFYK